MLSWIKLNMLHKLSKNLLISIIIQKYLEKFHKLYVKIRENLTNLLIFYQ